MKNVFQRIISFVLAAVLIAGLACMGGAPAVSAAEGGKIIVTYTGNTYQAPGDVVMLRVSDITKTVDINNIQLVRLEDTGIDSVGYIDRTSYDYDGVHDGEFTKAPSAPVADWSKAVTVKVVHTSTTDQSVQFIIPEKDADGNPMKHGIYAVKLTGPTDTKVVYLNAPVIDYVLGSEGSFAAPGTLLEIVGENIAPCQNANEDAVAAYKRYKDRNPEDLRAVLVNKADPSITYDLDIEEITSDYNIVVRIPSDIAVDENGATSKWEVYVYNGYGNETAWSIPIDVQVGKAWADRIPDNFINIQDYGATGYYKQNATPIIQTALNVLNEMGGGTLYLPEGAYRIEHTIYIPSNVHLKGESVGLTNILPTYLNDNYNDLPGTAVMLSGDNIEISGMSFYMKRCRVIINSYGEVKNIRLNNLKFYTHVSGWANNSEGQGAALLGRFEAFAYNESARDEGSACIGGKYENLRVTDINAVVNENNISTFLCYDPTNTYGYFENIDANSSGYGWNRGTFNYAVWKNVKLGGGTALEGHGVFQYNCTFGPTTAYNREITVADLDGMNGWYYEVYTEPGLAAEDSVYLKMYNHKGEEVDVDMAANWHEQEMQIYIQAGMDSSTNVDGLGQTRFITGIDSERNVIIINRPFADTSFTKTNFANTRRPREDIFWVDCNFYEGRCGGSFYGGCADVILDGSHREYNMDVYQYSKNGDCNWYMSFINECWENTPYSLIASLGLAIHPQSYQFKIQNRDHGTMGILIRNNDVYSMPIMFDNYNAMMMCDFIIDNNRFNDIEYLIYWEKNGTPDGLTLYRNSGNDLQTWGINALTNLSNNQYVTILDDQLGKVESSMLGDVNGDGLVTEHDAKYLEEALAGKIVLLPSAQANADLDGDDALTVMDVLYLRYYVSGEIADFPVNLPAGGGTAPDIGGDNGSDDDFTPGFH